VAGRVGGQVPLGAAGGTLPKPVDLTTPVDSRWTSTVRS